MFIGIFMLLIAIALFVLQGISSSGQINAAHPAPQSMGQAVYDIMFWLGANWALVLGAVLLIVGFFMIFRDAIRGSRTEKDDDPEDGDADET